MVAISLESVWFRFVIYPKSGISSREGGGGEEETMTDPLYSQAMTIMNKFLKTRRFESRCFRIVKWFKSSIYHGHFKRSTAISVVNVNIDHYILH